ncbi:NAD(P)-dependent dehydrogenase [Cnuibacter physcomitrellae]|uniref:2-hydroxypropyl-CoM dehydrogenase n=1 Tax=Cnuibacter physcomitrellae TaxID=1619308 RepID=A0A1X9LUJ0_9MICO|nr:glucose 1-dehydrogenase [Cnuibacter physcomitrellae]ARJ07681.1 2-hydroxypropyl-CoM dehydrogenase [Cnuibacter physcomitrellae]GGI42610.1 NAD(P)-dependent dehydrogenase [Cnuibacter physcomitrellae]
MSQKLKGRKAVVTGAGSGMGRAIAKRFAEEGASVAALDLDLAAAESTAQSIVEAGGTAFSLRVDVSDDASVRAAIDGSVTALGGIDVLANIAGILDGYAPVLETSEQLWDRIIGVDLKGPFLMTRAVLPTMLENGGGTIVNMASIAGFVARGGGAAYTSAKHGVIGLTKQTAADYGLRGIRVNAICPGAVETAMTKQILDEGEAAVIESINAVPAGRHAQPEEIANLALFLANDESSFVHGAAYVIDGGWTIV